MINETSTSEVRIGCVAATRQTCHGDPGRPATYMTIDDSLAPALRLAGVTTNGYENENVYLWGAHASPDRSLREPNEGMRYACAAGLRAACDYLGGPETGLPARVPSKPTGSGGPARCDGKAWHRSGGRARSHTNSSILLVSFVALRAARSRTCRGSARPQEEAGFPGYRKKADPLPHKGGFPNHTLSGRSGNFTGESPDNDVTVKECFFVPRVRGRPDQHRDA